MIRYALLCDSEHAFEAWFRDSDAFDEQSRAGMVDCPACGSSAVRKALMAPAVRTVRAQGPAVPSPEKSATEQAGTAPEQVVLPPGGLSDKARQMRALIRELHTKLRESADDVGSRFPEEARKIHDGESEPRAIYGSATGEQARALIEDGIAVMPLPTLPDERN